MEIEMTSSFKSNVTGLLCVAVAATAFAGNAWAGPVNAVSSGVIRAPSLTEQIYYRRYHRRYYGGYYRRGYYDPSGAAIAGVAAGLLGAAAVGVYGGPYYYGYPAYGYGYPVYGYPYYPGW